MNESIKWRNIKYDEVFDQELRGLERRRSFDLSCTIEDISNVLDGLYILDGSDWQGRGDLQDIIMAATIAAYEHFVTQWKAEKAT
jgi:hypothetical protein